MPTSYRYPVASPGGASVHTAPSGHYLFTVRFNPATRGLVMRDSRVDAGDPAIELVLMTLATPLGSYGPDPTLGLDYSLVTKQTANVQSTWKAAVEKALARFIPSRVTDLVVDVDPPVRGVLKYSVAFRDPRAGNAKRGPIPLVA